MRISFNFTFILLFFCVFLSAQENAQSIDRNGKWTWGQELFDDSAYSPSRFMLNQFIQLAHPATEDDFNNIKDDAEAMYVIGGLRLDLLNGEKEIVRFINKKYPDLSTQPAILELGSYYYNKKWYKKCIETYEMTEWDNISEEERVEAGFKKGYSHFVLKEFNAAKNTLEPIKNDKSAFYFPINYYYAMSEYFQKNFQGAVIHFDRVKSSDMYRSFTPYYLSQIYFVQGQYDKVIEQGEVALSDKELRHRKEIRQLLGQSYYKNEQYDKALPHLEYYEQHTEKLTVEEFYQLAFTQYRLGKYNEAINNFGELALLDDKIGQVVNYYLADCYYRTGDKLSARAAFKKVSQMDFEMRMKEEALFNYGKLAAETGLEREAINTLIKIEKDSKYNSEAEDIIVTLLDNMSDYATALDIMESMENINNKIKSTYQNVALKYGIHQYLNGWKDDALISFAKAEKYQSMRILSAQGAFWAGQIYHEKGDYPKSKEALNRYFKASEGITWMPDESSQMSAHYIMGYNYFVVKDYLQAEKQFRQVLSGFNATSGKIKNKDLIEKIWPDALVRVGDCLFKYNKYNEAMTFYTQAIQRQQGSVAYALYQKGMIEGLLGEPFEKILTLKEMTEKHPASEYADKAWLQLGDTYQEVDNVNNAYQCYNVVTTNYANSPLLNSAYLKMGLIAYNRGDLQTAIKNYKTVFQNNPSAKEQESALLGLQEIYINDLGQSDAYVQFVSSLPGYKMTETAADSLAYRVGAAKYNEGDYERAIAGFNNYLDKYPQGLNRIKAMYYRAESHTLTKNYDRALKSYEMLINVGRSEYFVQSLRKAALIAYNYTQEFDKAFEYYDLYHDAISDDAEKFKAALGAMRSAFRISNAKAIKKYSIAVSEHNLATQEDQATAYYYLAKTYLRENSHAEALKSFDKVSELSQNNQAAESRYMMAEILYKQGKINEAEEQCNQANAANAAYPFWIAKSLLLLTHIYLDRKDTFNARAAAEAVIENFKEDEDLLKEAQAQLKLVEEVEKEKNRIKPSHKDTDILELIPSGGKP